MFVITETGCTDGIVEDTLLVAGVGKINPEAGKYYKVT